MECSELKRIRKALGLTQKDFSDELGIQQSNYSKYERGAASIPPYIEKSIQFYIEAKGVVELIEKVERLETDKLHLTNEIKKIDQDIEESKDRSSHNPGSSALGIEGAKG
ncbi:helix-turn-helix domain-containing protein [bacterium]|nr:helix-turn-helix domain-containing protein [bacterium]